MTTDTEYLREIAERLEKIDRKIRDYSLIIIAALGFIAGCLISS